MTFKKQYDILDLVNDLDQVSDLPPKPIFTGNEDPVALSWAVYHNWCTRGYDRWADFTAVKPTDEDYGLAEDTRKYYRHRYLMRTLGGRELTPFQQELHNMIERGAVFETEKGMLYKLPYLYLEDKQTEDVYNETTNNPNIKSDVLTTMELSPITSVYVCRRTGDVRKYWWKTQDNIAVEWPVPENNVLRHLVDSIHGRGEPVKVIASPKHRISRDYRQHHYYQIVQVRLA